MVERPRKLILWELVCYKETIEILIIHLQKFFGFISAAKNTLKITYSVRTINRKLRVIPLKVALPKNKYNL